MDKAKTNVKMPIILSQVCTLIYVNRGCKRFSIFLSQGLALTINFSILERLISLFSIQTGSQGARIPSIICTENMNSGMEKNVVYPGGTGTGRQSGSAAIASRTPKPRSCKVFLISPTFRVSLRYTTTTFSSNSDVERPLMLLLLWLLSLIDGFLEFPYLVT